MATTISAKYQAGRNHLETANDERELTLIIRRNGNYSNFIVTVDGRSFQVGSYFAPRKSFEMSHRDYAPLADAFRALLSQPAAPAPALRVNSASEQRESDAEYADYLRMKRNQPAI